MLVLFGEKAQAYSFSEQNSQGVTLYYTITDVANNYVKITNPNGESYQNTIGWLTYDGSTTPLDIPSTVTNERTTYTIKGIGYYAFNNCSRITGALTIPDNVTTIGNSAFIL
jgi:hypothetical protein